MNLRQNPLSKYEYYSNKYGNINNIVTFNNKNIVNRRSKSPIPNNNNKSFVSNIRSSTPNESDNININDVKGYIKKGGVLKERNYISNNIGSIGKTSNVICYSKKDGGRCKSSNSSMNMNMNMNMNEKKRRNMSTNMSGNEYSKSIIKNNCGKEKKNFCLNKPSDNRHGCINNDMKKEVNITKNIYNNQDKYDNRHRNEKYNSNDQSKKGNKPKEEIFKIDSKIDMINKDYINNVLNEEYYKNKDFMETQKLKMNRDILEYQQNKASLYIYNRDSLNKSNVFHNIKANTNMSNLSNLSNHSVFINKQLNTESTSEDMKSSITSNGNKSIPYKNENSYILNDSSKENITQSHITTSSNKESIEDVYILMVSLIQSVKRKERNHETVTLNPIKGLINENFYVNSKFSVVKIDEIDLE